MYSKKTASGEAVFRLYYFFFSGGGPGRCFLRPVSFRFLSSRYSICPLTLRNSSAAHFSSALNMSILIRMTKFFFSFTGWILRLLM
jgi:hypothetical protein